MPDLTISTGGGDATFGGDFVGRDKGAHSQVEHDGISLAVALSRIDRLEKQVEVDAEMIGLLRSEVSKVSNAYDAVQKTVDNHSDSIGAIQSKVVNNSTGQVVLQERVTFVVMGGLALIILSGLLSIVVAMVIRP